MAYELLYLVLKLRPTFYYIAGIHFDQSKSGIVVTNCFLVILTL
jgi:hypothetical protein